MSEIAIHVEDLGKLYHIGERQRYKALRDTLSHALYAPFRAAASLRNGHNGHHSTASNYSSNNHFWALKDISFEIKRGEAVGIVGSNGAGKSTLLKILSRISKPTKGYVRIHGRIGSLLEVGTGFHPELTGRENIYLNGAIIGMRKKEIDRKFDQIVAFAEIEKFIDTPVKFYSSGMYVRLAFAVAAHLEPEILLVDEVLAVGDGKFQKKCLGKMGDITRQEGRTVLFVSHNMNAVMELCSRALLLEASMKKMDGPPKDVVAVYMAKEESQAEVNLVDLTHNGPQHYARLRRLRLLDEKGNSTTTFTMNEPFLAQIEVQCLRRMPDAEIGLKISSSSGSAIHYLTSTWEGLRVDLEPGIHAFEVKVSSLLLFPGTYMIGLWVSRDGEWADTHVQEVTHFTVLKGDVTGYRTRMEEYAVSGCEVHAPSVWKILSLKPGGA
jgi:lipopolysaccharide transport system ATP-binding protein